MSNSAERLMVQRMKRSRARESLDMLSNTYGVVDNRTDLERSVQDVVDVYETMVSAGFHLLPEDTSEKKAFRQLESKLKALKVINKVAPKVDAPALPVEEVK